ncbi:hypothetical protein [Rhizobium mongolense]|uniref:hypothetical protein n=1 Tax=Rhizobium mongolense TaxID=57676 RepID=UPI0034A1DA79
MPHKFNADRRDKIAKQKYQVTNSSCRPDAGTSVLRDLIIFLLSDSMFTSEECRLRTA